MECAHFSGLHKLALLNMELCCVTAACLDSLSAIEGLLHLNLSRCNMTGDGCDKFSRLKGLKSLNLGFNDISDDVLVHLKGASYPFIIFLL
ncbi:putative leucine-rich repeat domain superfamily [Helianthus annuus]|nr:putative leucine-rich repeat domain superfamily [Helianthus annuus]